MAEGAQQQPWSMRWSVIAMAAVAGLVVIGTIEHARGALVAAQISAIATWQYVFLAVIAAGVLLTLGRRVQSRFVWEGLFTVTAFLGVWFITLWWLPVGGALVVSAVLTLMHVFGRVVMIHNAFMLIGGCGVALTFAGWLQSDVLFLLIVGLSIADHFATAPQGAITELAKTLMRVGVVPGYIIVPSLRDLGSTTMSLLRTGRGALLGAGDIILPTALIAGVAFREVTSAVMVLAGVLVGAFALTRRGVEEPRAALPVLATGAAIPYLILRFIGRI